MRQPVDFSAFTTGTPVWRVRVDYTPNAAEKVIQDTVLGIDATNRRLVTLAFPENSTMFQMDKPEDGYLYMTEPVFHTSWLLFQNEQAAQEYLHRQTLLRQVWETATQHKRLENCSTAQLEQLLRILNDPQGE